MKASFPAHWSSSLKAISAVSTLLLVGVAWAAPSEALRGLMVVLMAGCALFTVRGYEVGEGFLRVRRLFWTTRIPLGTLSNAEWRPGPFGWAWRLFGNGGLYSFTGWYRQKGLGTFRALATSTDDAVILKFSDRKPIVLTPEDPAGFLKALDGGLSQQA